jgi:phospholipase C
MDGFDRGGISTRWAYTQLTKQQLPNYWRWARQNVLADNFFSSETGPSFPNHLYAIAAQSGGAVDNPRRTGFSSNTFGCDAPPQQRVQVLRHGSFTYVRPCFEFQTVGGLLDAHGVPWAYYAANDDQKGYIWSAYSAIRRYREERARWRRHVFPVDNVVADIRAGRLPPVTWITPRFELSDHPPWNSRFAMNWVTGIVNAIMRTSMWQHTAIFLTWDEWGGFYDHVPPRRVDEVGLGFRVPLLTISPYAKRGYVDDALGEFSTPLRFVSDNWGLDYLTRRIADAHNFEHVFEFGRRPRTDARPLSMVKGAGSPFVFPRDFKGWPKGVVPTDAAI